MEWKEWNRKEGMKNGMEWNNPNDERKKKKEWMDGIKNDLNNNNTLKAEKNINNMKNW